MNGSRPRDCPPGTRPLVSVRERERQRYPCHLSGAKGPPAAQIPFEYPYISLMYTEPYIPPISVTRNSSKKSSMSWSFWIVLSRPYT